MIIARIVIIMYMCTVMYVDNHVSTIMRENSHVWAQTCLGTNMSRRKCVWAQSCGHKHVLAQMSLGTSMYGNSSVVPI